MDWLTFLQTNLDVKIVSVLLIWAAWIDGKELRVPNWMTFPMVATGIIWCTVADGWSGLGFSLLGMVAGLVTLLPLYSVGGMGAGDVKLMAGIGAWLGWKITVAAFCVSTVVGAIMAVFMVLYSGKLRHHYDQFMLIALEWMNVRDPRELSRIAAERKPRMMLLPYGIPICIGSIGYFMYAGMI